MVSVEDLTGCQVEKIEKKKGIYPLQGPEISHAAIISGSIKFRESVEM